jgi:hypothetical protein
MRLYMAVEEFLLFALAVIYIVLPYRHPIEYPAEGGMDQKQDSGMSQHGR